MKWLSGRRLETQFKLQGAHSHFIKYPKLREISSCTPPFNWVSIWEWGMIDWPILLFNEAVYGGISYGVKYEYNEWYKVLFIRCSLVNFLGQLSSYLRDLLKSQILFLVAWPIVPQKGSSFVRSGIETATPRALHSAPQSQDYFLSKIQLRYN